MTALITGASGGIGRDMALELSRMGYSLILVARSKEKLEKLKSELETEAELFTMDLSDEKNCYELYEKTKDKNIDILINNAGYGLFGDIDTIPLEDEINMLSLNVRALHILTKLFLMDFIKRDSGRILNVSSMAGLMLGGPLLTSYYATKAYVSSFTRGIYQELKDKKSSVTISQLCPGPVSTGFNKRAGVSSFSVKSLDSEYVAKYAIKKMFRGKLTIVPGFIMKCGVFFSRFASEKMILKITQGLQKKKGQ